MTRIHQIKLGSRSSFLVDEKRRELAYTDVPSVSEYEQREAVAQSEGCWSGMVRDLGSNPG